MSKPMTMHEFYNVPNHAMRYNGPFVTRLIESPCVKYVDPRIDLRTNTVFSIVFRGFGDETVLHCQNECRDLPASLHERCMGYLQGRPVKFRCGECENDVDHPCRIEGCPISKKPRGVAGVINPRPCKDCTRMVEGPSFCNGKCSEA